MTETYTTGTPDEFDVFAKELEETAQLWRKYGRRARTVAREWVAGAKGVSLEPSRGAIYEACTDPQCVEWQDVLCVDDACPEQVEARQHTHRVGVTHSHPVPHDAVGEAAVAGADRVSDRLHRLDRARQLIAPLAREMRGIVRETCPQATGLQKVTLDTEADIAGAGWCVSCWRDNKHTEPRAVDGKGRTIYANFCRWCGDFVGAHRDVLGAQGMPPLELVKLRHQGKRVPSGKVTKALDRIRRERGLT